MAATTNHLGKHALTDKEKPIVKKAIKELQEGMYFLAKSTWVIPCQINTEFGVTSRILTKLGVIIVPVMLTTCTKF